MANNRDCRKCFHKDVCYACSGWYERAETCTKYAPDVVEVEKYNELRDSFVDYACSGGDNLAPYCTNRCIECTDERGWCRYGVNCRGFNPDGERK